MLKRSVVLAFVVSSFACGGEDDLTRYGQAAAQLYDAKVLAQYRPEARAYVMGHGLGVYLYSRTLPAWIDGSGYKYRPGASAKRGRVEYDYVATVNGEMEEVPPPLPGDECYRAGDEVHCPEPPAGGADDPENDPGAGGGADDPESDPGSGDEPDHPCDDDEEDLPDPDGHLDEDCESFLDPAAMQARAMITRLDAELVLAQHFDREELIEAREAFELGFADALALEDREEETRASEPNHIKRSVRRAGLCEHSPIVLDLDGDGITLSDPKTGVLFDLRETGRVVRTSWPKGGDALLVYDRDGDGRITHGGELFGNSFKSDGTRWGDGFASLAALDVVELGGNGDGVIDPNDEVYSKLMIWTDSARDGASEENELSSLAGAGIISLSVEADRRFVVDRFGNTIPLWSEFIRQEKDEALVRGTMADAWFRIRAAELPTPIAQATEGAR